MVNGQRIMLMNYYPTFNRLLICMLAVLLRVLAYIYCTDFLKMRPELNVPQNSFQRLTDGVYMLRDGVSPYDGDTVHCQPALLYLFAALIDHPNLLLAVFLLLDMVTSEILRVVATVYLKTKGSSAKNIERTTDLVSKCYMFNPVAVASCSIFSLSVVYNLITALFILAFVKDELDVRDLTPNIGIFWYFFTEIFNHFRYFFLWVFQVNIIVYLVPLSLTLRSNAFLLLHLLMIHISVFASYPSMADGLIYLSLLPLFGDLKKYFRWGLFSGGAMCATIVLAPVMWEMWIVTGSGNANFYFAVALTYSVAQIFLLTDLLYSYLRLKLIEGREITDESKIAVLMFK